MSKLFHTPCRSRVFETKLATFKMITVLQKTVKKNKFMAATFIFYTVYVDENISRETKNMICHTRVNIHFYICQPHPAVCGIDSSM